MELAQGRYQGIGTFHGLKGKGVGFVFVFTGEATGKWTKPKSHKAAEERSDAGSFVNPAELKAKAARRSKEDLAVAAGKLAAASAANAGTPLQLFVAVCEAHGVTNVTKSVGTAAYM